MSSGEWSERDTHLVRAAELAVALWAEFPLTLNTRPLVLLDGPVRSEGFRNGIAKIAFGLGRVDADAGVPQEVVRSLRVPQFSMQNPPDGRLRVTAAEEVEVDFATDRGRQCLPAWRVDAEDSLGPIWVLTEHVQSRCWSPSAADSRDGLGPHMLSSATIGPGDQDLVVQFVGGKEELFCYESKVVETSTAVAVAPLQRPTNAIPPGAILTLEGHRRIVEVRLQEPFDGRVLVNLDGSPVPVTSLTS